MSTVLCHFATVCMICDFSMCIVWHHEVHLVEKNLLQTPFLIIFYLMFWLAASYVTVNAEPQKSYVILHILCYVLYVFHCMFLCSVAMLSTCPQKLSLIICMYQVLLLLRCYCMVRAGWLVCQFEVRATSIFHRPRTAAAAETRSGRGRCSRLHPWLPTLCSHSPKCYWRT